MNKLILEREDRIKEIALTFASYRTFKSLSKSREDIKDIILTDPRR